MYKFNFFIYTVVVLLLLIIDCDGSTNSITVAVDTNSTIYYDLKTNTVLPIELADSSRLPSQPMKYISRGFPCSCSQLECGCCIGMNLTAINFDREACTNITFVPEEFALDFNVLIDKKEVFTNRLTARNPPPACVPLYFFPAITFCVRFFDLHFVENKFNACIDFETKVALLPMFILHFNCVKVGEGHITWVPNNDVVPAVNANDSDTEVYDQVNFELSDEDTYLHTSTLTPEEENHIGTLKLT